MKEWFVILLAIVFLIYAPIAGIWSLNTLFDLGIELTSNTWLAAFILLFILNGTRK